VNKFRFVLAVMLVLLPATLSADVSTFNPYSSPNVTGAINSGSGFYIGNDLYGQFAYASGPYLYASGAAYSDAGVVLYLNGGLTLGQLQSVSVDSTGSPLAVNLWLDTGGDGKFFALGGFSGYELTGLNGDSYAGCGAPSLSASSSCYMLGGDGAGKSYTLADLQAGAVAGIDGNTPTALWIGVTNPGGQTLTATVNSVTVATPEPAWIITFAISLLGLGGFAVLRRRYCGNGG
jgi:hypothetical protein